VEGGGVLKEPLDPPRAKAQIVSILAGGAVTFSKHALEEMADDDLTTVDVAYVLRAGAVDPGELEHGSWRYGVRTQRIEAIVAFRSETELVVVTAWKR
jgi:hypothetical protein